MHYQRHFPALTNRYVFEPERTPSPVADHPTNRRVFQPEPVASPTMKPPHPSESTTSRDNGRDIISRDTVRTKFTVVYPSGSKPQTSQSISSRFEEGDVFTIQSLCDGPSRGLPLIPRPQGSLSKPNGGGYCLKEVLGWDDANYKLFQKDVHDLCQKHFDVKVAYHEQDPEAITNYCHAAKDRHPELNRYASFWPAEDFARMYLKNSAAQARKKERGPSVVEHD